MSRRAGHKAYLFATIVAAGLVALPFLFWYDTWFGRRLTDSQIQQYFAEAASTPRRAQHALVQIGERLSRGDRGVERWYPQIAQLAGSPSAELRQTAAWLMGQDARHAPFRQTLLGMLGDSSVLVRRNAALSLAAFRDPTGRRELRGMLEPYTVVSTVAGSVRYRLKAGDYVNPGTLVARVGASEVRAPVPGEVRVLLKPEGAQAAEHDALMEISPDERHAWEALRALYLVGAGSDAEDVRRFARGVPGMSENLQKQAMLTLEEIRSRER